MPEHIGFRCKVCNHGFVAEALTEHERDQKRRWNEPMGRIMCPRCNSDQVERV